jgi:large subunit ribosomal protein L24
MGVMKKHYESKSVHKIRLKKGDKVIVLTGKDKGKTGLVLATHPVTNKVTVENINMAKKHQKPSQSKPQGGIVDLTRPIAVSNVAIVEPSSKKASKIGYKFDKSGNKVRVYKRSNKEIK